MITDPLKLLYLLINIKNSIYLLYKPAKTYIPAPNVDPTPNAVKSKVVNTLAKYIQNLIYLFFKINSKSNNSLPNLIDFQTNYHN